MYEGIFRELLFPGYETFVRRRGTSKYLSAYERTQHLSPADLGELQLCKLNKLLDHCWRHVPFLQAFWTQHEVGRNPLRHVSELSRYPFLTKAHITANYESMIAEPWRGRTLTKTTGGSTGDPFRLEYTMDSYARRTAVMWRGYKWAGAGLGTRTAYLWGTGQRKEGWGAVKDRLYHGAFNRRFFDAFSLRDDNIDEYIDQIARYKPDAVVGYVAPVVLVARRMNRLGRKFSGIRGVLTGAEALFASERREIEQAFNCQVFNTYGCREFMLIAAECEHHVGLHVSADHLIVETVDGAGQPVRGESGDVAITDLHNFGMPFVRYLNGDRATHSMSQCSCGRGLPLLSSIDGRVLDLIHTPDGRQVLGEFFVYVMLDWTEVKQWQVAQTAPDALEFRLVTSQPLNAEQKAKLVAKARVSVGNAMRIDVVEVDVIPAARSGKRQLTVALPRENHAAPPRFS